jgi:threonine dehydrogenase-like Zn-dependent dehydrogenase
MKAAVVEKPNVLVVRDLPEPELTPYEALCELLYGATCTGTDSHIIDGSFPWISPLPTVLGHESVGRVVKVGAKVRNFRAGDIITRVGTPPAADCSVTWGGFTEFGLARDHWAMCADGRPESEWKGSRWNQVVPAAVDPRVAPMFTTWRETLSYITRMGVAAGRSVLVVGSGGNGLSYARHAVLLGASPVVLVGAARTKEAALEHTGVQAYFDYRSDSLAQDIKAAFGAGFDFIIDAVGKVGISDAVLACLKPGGKYGTYGIDDMGKIRINPAAAPGAVHLHPISYDEAETHQQVSELVLQGRLKPDLWYDVSQPFPLTDINGAFDAVRGRKTVKALVKLR